MKFRDFENVCFSLVIRFGLGWLILILRPIRSAHLDIRNGAGAVNTRF